MVRVRFAPSPTGFLHIGGLRTALYNELFALRHGGVFVLRIEDTDRTRCVEGAVESLLATLEWAGIRPAEGPYLEDGLVKERGEYGPYVQSSRLDLYREHAEKLIATGHAYRCFCAPERLEEVKKSRAAAKQPLMYDKLCRSCSVEDATALVAKGIPSVVRLRVPDAGATAFDDAIRGTVSFENAFIDDQVLVKSDGYPTYHLASVVDDHLMAITHVIRGEEWLPSTPKHLLLYQALGWEPPSFAHLPLLLNADRSKLSKRQGDVAVEDYEKRGYLPEAMVNFVALLGWNPSGDREVYAKDELAKEFDLGKINKGGAVFNVDKLNWLNREYLKAMPAPELACRVEPFCVEQGLLKREGERTVFAAGGEEAGPLLEKAVALEQRRLTTLAEFPEAITHLFAGKLAFGGVSLAAKKSTPEKASECLAGFKEFLASLGDGVFSDAKALEKETLAFVASKGWTNAESLWPLRVALTGRAASPSPFDVAWALGKNRTLARVEDALRSLA